MGLDQYAYVVRPHRENTDFTWFWQRPDDDTPLAEGLVTEIAYWRKHPNLHGFMYQLYAEKMEELGRGDELVTASFNCIPLRLQWHDLDALEKAVRDKTLPETSGFFFGEDSDEHYYENDLAFIEMARQALRQDMNVYYDSWW